MKKKSIFKFLIIFLVFSFICILLIFCYKLEKDKLKSFAEESEFGLVCIGDSLTHGTGGAYISYPDYLYSITRGQNNYIPIYNLGIGGENTLTIAGRMGAIPFELNSFTIPQEGKVKVSFINPLQTPFKQDGNSGINPCTISGIEGNLSYDGSDYYFERTNSGDSIDISSNTIVETYANSFYKDGIFIVFMGENNGYENIDDLIYQQQSILNLQEKNKDKFLIIGLCTGTRDERSKLESKLSETYGDKFYNIRENLSNQDILNSYNISLNESDLEKVSNGEIPDSIKMDDIHFNSDGYYILADQIYNKLNQLGYFDEINKSADKFNKHWSFIDKIVKFIKN